MAKSRCSCGQLIRWKADEPESDEWWLAAKSDLDDFSASGVSTAAVDAAFCSACGHLWVAWDRSSETLSEYAPVDPSVRPS